MNYLKLYTSLTSPSRVGNRSKKTGCYEKHHILPKSLGGSGDKSNLILLTPREHYLAHWLLFKMYSGTDKAKMAYAFFQMTKCNHQHARQITSRQYERAKEAMSTVKGENHPAYGKSFWNDEDRSRMSLSKQGELNPMFGKPSWNKGLDSSDPRIASISEKSTATRKEKFAAGLYGDNYKRSEKHKKIVGDTMRGKPKSEEHRKKLSEAFKGVKQSRSVCPHCNKEGGSSAMKRFHFDNCKYK